MTNKKFKQLMFIELDKIPLDDNAPTGITRVSEFVYWLKDNCTAFTRTAFTIRSKERAVIRVGGTVFRLRAGADLGELYRGVRAMKDEVKPSRRLAMPRCSNALKKGIADGTVKFTPNKSGISSRSGRS
jgi:hypothetical protein